MLHNRENLQMILQKICLQKLSHFITFQNWSSSKLINGLLIKISCHMPLCIPSHIHDMGHVQPTWRDVCFHFHVPAESISTPSCWIHTLHWRRCSGAGSLCVPFVVERFVPLKGWLLKRCRRAHSFVWTSSINNMTSGKLTEALEVFDKEENGSANRTQGWNNTGRVTRLSPPPMRWLHVLSALHTLQWPAEYISLNRPSSCPTHTSVYTITTPFCLQYKLSNPQIC